MVLVLQLNGELPENFPGHDRRIFVFSCRNSQCSRKDGSIRALRSVRASKEAADEARRRAEEEAQKQKEKEELDAAARKAKENTKPAPGLGNTLFGGTGLGSASGANPFSTNNNPFSSGATSAAANPFPTTAKPPAQPEQKQKEETRNANTGSTLSRTFAETLSLNNLTPSAQAPSTSEPWPEASSLPKPYPTLYLVDVDYETLDPTPQSLPANVKMETGEPSSGAGSSSATEAAFESAMDATFLKFADRMAQNPEQVIRYEFKGQPLLYAKDDAVGKKILGSGMPRCSRCGAKRVFELQLTPHAITELEAEELSVEGGMDWGTVIVGVCERDCLPVGVGDGEVGYVEEWAGVQWEELRA